MRRAVLVLLLAAGCAKDAPPARDDGPAVAVAVVASDLPAGTPLAVTALAQREVPERFLSPNVVRVAEVSTLMERRTMIPLRSGDLLLHSALENAEPVQALSPEVATGRRAMWVELSDPVEPWAYLRAGDRVDLLGAFRNPETNEQMARTVLQNLQVLGTSVRGASSVGRSVAVLVTPEEAERLLLASQLGSLAIAVRGKDDQEVRARLGTPAEALLRDPGKSKSK